MKELKNDELKNVTGGYTTNAEMDARGITNNYHLDNKAMMDSPIEAIDFERVGNNTDARNINDSIAGTKINVPSPVNSTTRLGINNPLLRFLNSFLSKFH